VLYNINQNIYENTCLGQEKNEDELETEVESDNDLKVGDLLQFDFETIRLATRNFSNANMLGEGGFGIVYKVNNYPFFIFKLKNTCMHYAYIS
jgi:hypothetical protein